MIIDNFGNLLPTLNLMEKLKLKSTIREQPVMYFCCPQMSGEKKRKTKCMPLKLTFLESKEELKMKSLQKASSSRTKEVVIVVFSSLKMELP